MEGIQKKVKHQTHTQKVPRTQGEGNSEQASPNTHPPHQINSYETPTPSGGHQPVESVRRLTHFRGKQMLSDPKGTLSLDAKLYQRETNAV